METDGEIGFCKNCGTFGNMCDDGLCKLCYDEQMDDLYKTSDDDSMCEFEDAQNYIDQDLHQKDGNIQKELQKTKHLVQDIVIPFIFNSAESITCAVCMENITKGAKAVSLPCAHIFHSQCIDPWLQKNSHCPICRTNILGHNNETFC